MDLHSHLDALHHELEQYKDRVGEGFAQRTADVEAEIERVKAEIAGGDPVPPAPPATPVFETAGGSTPTIVVAPPVTLTAAGTAEDVAE